ncbi:MAG: DUF2339 domain-containing protein [Candidatus Gracilibacteria bacterium]|nr:DUF2339 domain-containing protein [Candidatus Gracilibacteria bacterium]
MTKLLNRIALLVSILMGFFITFSIYGLFGGFRYFSGEDVFVFIIVTITIGLFFKKLYLGEIFIKEKLDFLANQLEKRLIESRFTYTSKEKIQEKSSGNLNEYEKIKEEINNLPQETFELKQDKLADLLPELENEPEIKTSLKTNLIPKVEKIEQESIIMKNIKDFFKENILAKIGSILVFLGVLFLLSLIWNTLPSLGKIIIGFIIGFSIYFTGVILDGKGLKGESRILLGTGILINFLVILGGKYVLDGNVNSTHFFSTGVTFLFLILNTIFGVITSIAYKSKTLLTFSFIFAYLNPFLIGGNSDTPYTLIGYSTIVSIGAYIIGSRENNNVLKISSFVLGNVLFLSAPFTNEIGWIAKFIAMGVWSFAIIWNLYLNNYSKISSVFVASFVFLILGLMFGSSQNIINSSLCFVTYIISILFFFFVGITLFVKKAITSIAHIIFFPILIILGLLFTGNLYFAEFSLGIIVISYLIAFSLIGNTSRSENSTSSDVKYFMFSLLGVFIFIFNGYLSFTLKDISFVSFVSVLIVSFVFLISSYIFSYKSNLNNLYAIGTFGSIFILLPVINIDFFILKNNFGGVLNKEELVGLIRPLSIIAISAFAILNTLWPFFNKKLIENKANILNLISGLIAGVIFIGFELFRYGNEYFPGVTLGLAFAGLAVYYTILSFIFISNIGIENIKNEVAYKNSLFGYLFIAISVFSLAIALIFSKSPEVVSLVWLFEATILFYFFSKTKETKIYNTAIILFIVGIVKLIDLQFIVNSGELLFLVPIALIIISFVLNIKYLDYLENGTKKSVHDIVHIIGMLVVSSIIVKIVPQTNHGWSTLGIASFVTIAGLIYNNFKSKILKTFFIFLAGFFMMYQISSFDYIAFRLKEDVLRHLIILQYASTGLIAAITIYWNKYNKTQIYNTILNAFISIYLLIILSDYIYNIFENTFAITIFWGIISIYLLIRGISNDKIKIRTIGLYLLSLVLAKIFLYDIWYGLDNAVSRVVVFILLGVLLIFVSTKYSRKYGNNLVGEFNLNNLSNSKNEEKPSTKQEVNNEDITSQIKNIDLKGITQASFKINGKAAFSTKSKNILQIIIYVLRKTGLKEFEANELKPFYDFIIANYHSDLSTRDLNTVQNAFKTFVEAGGEVVLK